MEAERALGSRLLVRLAIILAVGSAAALGVAWLMGWVSDPPIALAMAIVFGVTLALLELSPVFAQMKGSVRAAGILVAGLTLFAVLYPAREVALPGAPSAEGRLSTEAPDLRLPGPGSYRLIASTHLGAGADTTIDYSLKIGEESVSGVLERVHARRRVGRRGSADVVEDHDSNAHKVQATGAAPMVHLERLHGKTLTVRAYAVIPDLVYWGVLALLLVAAIWVESRVKARGALMVTALAAICFGLIVEVAAPGNPIGAVLWSALLAAGAGALGVSVRNLFFPKRQANPAEPTAPKR